MELYNPISEEIKSMLLDRLTNEYEAHFFYTNAANWCESTGYNKAANYYKEESATELTHAGKLMTFLNNWGVSFTVPSESVTPVFDSLPDTIGKAYAIEVALYKSYCENANTVENAERSTYMLLLEMVNIQYESVAEYRTLLDKLSLYDEDKTSIKLFEKEAFKN